MSLHDRGIFPPTDAIEPTPVEGLMLKAFKADRVGSLSPEAQETLWRNIGDNHPDLADGISYVRVTLNFAFSPRYVSFSGVLAEDFPSLELRLDDEAEVVASAWLTRSVQRIFSKTGRIKEAKEHAHEIAKQVKDPAVEVSGEQVIKAMLDWVKAHS